MSAFPIIKSQAYRHQPCLPQTSCYSTGGNLTREPDQDRIDFLAQVRNAALEPLWLKVTSESGRSNTWFDPKGPSSEVLWPADKVIFLNDVYFCARDAVRLLLHDADMACGMDFDRRKLDQVSLGVRSIKPTFPPHVLTTSNPNHPHTV